MKGRVKWFVILLQALGFDPLHALPCLCNMWTNMSCCSFEMGTLTKQISIPCDLSYTLKIAVSTKQ